MRSKDELMENAASDIQGIYAAMQNIGITLADTLGSEKMGDCLDSITKMADTITEYYQMLIDEKEELSKELVF